MIERFKDRRLLISALKKQTIIANDQKLAEIIADKVELIQFNEDEVLINEEAEDNDLYFILIGSVVITIHQREIAIRKANQHIGELSLIDPSAKRSATIRVNELSVFAKISEPNFSLISIKHINLWRNIAIEIGDRLRQRNRFIFPPNPRPQVFIGCSTESLQIAQAIQSGLTHDDFNVKIWTDGVFKPSTFPIEALEDYIIHADFGILVVTPDDIIELRGRSDPSARDNVIFELGVCMGDYLGGGHLW